MGTGLHSQLDAGSGLQPEWGSVVPSLDRLACSSCRGAHPADSMDLELHETIRRARL